MSMKIEIESDQNGDYAVSRLYIENRPVTSARSDTAAQALADLARSPSLPLYVLEWLVPKDGAFTDLYELRDLRSQQTALEETNAILRGVIDDTGREAASLRHMIDLLLDRIEGRRE